MKKSTIVHLGYDFIGVLFLIVCIIMLTYQANVSGAADYEKGPCIPASRKAASNGYCTCINAVCMSYYSGACVGNVEDVITAGKCGGTNSTVKCFMDSPSTFELNKYTQACNSDPCEWNNQNIGKDCTNSCKMHLTSNQQKQYPDCREE